MAGSTRAAAWRTLAAASSFVLLAACGGGEESLPTGQAMDSAGAEPTAPSSPALDAPPRIEDVTLDPRSPQPRQLVRARVDALDPEGQELRFEYEWTVDGRRVEGATGPSLRVDGDTEKGSVVAVEVVALDPANQRSRAARASARVGNSPPVLHGIMIEPLGEIMGGRDITAVPKARDPDGDEISFEYRWAVNGSTVRNNEGSGLPGSAFSRGDTVTVTVVASDGTDESEPLRSDPIPVVNAPPRITSTPGSFDDQGRFVYRVQAEDPDGDSGFRYRLLEAPAGMDLDIVDGTVSWTPRESQAGRHPVKIQVSDAKGASTVQSFVMDLDFEAEDVARSEPEAAPPAAAP